MHLLLFDPLADQSEDEIHERINSVIVFLNPKAK